MNYSISQKDHHSYDFEAHRRGLTIRKISENCEPDWLDICLEAALEDPHPFPRSEGARALVKAADNVLVPRLAEILGAEVPAAVAWRAERLLIRRDPQRAIQALESELTHEQRQRRIRAAEALGRLGPLALPTLYQLATSEHPELRRKTAKACASIVEADSVAIVVALLNDEDREVILAALRAYARLADNRELAHALEQGFGSIFRLATSPDSEVCDTALETAARLGALLPRRASLDELRHTLSKFLNDSNKRRQSTAAQVAAHLGQDDVLIPLIRSLDPTTKLTSLLGLARCDSLPPELLTVFDESDATIRAALVRTLGRHWQQPKVRQVLQQATTDKDVGVRWLAMRALAGRFDKKLELLFQGRLPSDQPSAQWPYGLPPPQKGQNRRGRLPLAVATFNPSYNLNIGVLIRSAEAAGAQEVMVVGRDFYHRLAAMGADLWLELSSFGTADEMVMHARSRGYQLVAVQQAPGAERFDLADYPPRPCLILGTEGPGLPPDLCVAADLVVEIPQRGEIDSLNVATAGTLVLWACLSRNGWI